jgi:hypothetical protein
MRIIPQNRDYLKCPKCEDPRNGKTTAKAYAISQVGNDERADSLTTSTVRYRKFSFSTSDDLLARRSRLQGAARKGTYANSRKF